MLQSGRLPTTVLHLSETILRAQLYVNIEAPSITRAWEVLPLSMHEGVPGHHLQRALLDENDQIGALGRWLSVNAFTDGWAVYAETLGPAMELDITPQRGIWAACASAVESSQAGCRRGPACTRVERC
jgi:hypothetical protein